MSELLTEATLELFLQIAPLNNNNYEEWAIRMMDALSECKCGDIITGKEGRPFYPEQDRVEWNARCDFARYRIRSRVSFTNLLTIRDCQTAKQAWDTLERNYKLDNATRKVRLSEGFENLHCEEGGSIRDYIDQFRTLLAEAADLKMDCTNETYAVQFLRGLPSSFSDFVTINTASPSPLTPEVALRRIVNHKLYYRERLPASQQTKATVVCQRCSKRGHFQADCWDVIGRPEGMRGNAGRRGNGRNEGTRGF